MPACAGPEPGLTRDPTSGWLRHDGRDLQLVDTAGWKKATAAAPTQAPSTPAGGAGAAAKAAAAAQASARSPDSRELVKQLADASLVAARRALGACHVAVLLLDAPRLLEIERVRAAAALLARSRAAARPLSQRARRSTASCRCSARAARRPCRAWSCSWPTWRCRRARHWWWR